MTSRPSATTSPPPALTCTPWTQRTFWDGKLVHVIDGLVHTMWERTCVDAAGHVIYSTDERVTGGKPIDWPDLRRSAEATVTKRLPLPQPVLAPPADAGIVHAGTWFWTEPSTWRPVTARAEVPGAWVEVTARPARLRFLPGDGKLGTGEVRCAGPGPVWQPAMGDDAPSPCMYTYDHSSALDPSGRFGARLTIEWDVTYRQSDGRSGTMAPLASSAGVRVLVREVQALVTH